jgi:hypothetical protein
MAFPVIESVAVGTVVANDSTWDVTYPSGVSAGNLLVLILGSDGSGVTLSSISGGLSWLFNQISGAAETILYAKAVAAGGESGTITATISATEQGCWAFLRISGWQGTIGTTFDNAAATGAVAVARTSGSSTTPNAPSLDPTNWVIEDTLWLNAAVNDGTPTYTNKDANYTYITGSPQSSGGTAGAGLAVSSRNNAVGTEDPGAYTLSATETWAAITVGIRPSGVAPAATKVNVITAGV